MKLASSPGDFLPHVSDASHDTLEAMQQAAASASVSTFVATLASITAAPANEIAWNDEGLEDDVAVFSDEAAPQGRVRRCAGSSPGAPAQAQFGGSGLSITEAEEAMQPLQDRKRASITIRLSTSECAQLRARAAESGMTVSAYLRSCSLEVESLRAQVKEALAQLRTEPQQKLMPAIESNSEPAALKREIAIAGPACPQPRNRWFAKIWPRPRTAAQAA